jgi:hypothetical protein
MIKKKEKQKKMYIRAKSGLLHVAFFFKPTLSKVTITKQKLLDKKIKTQAYNLSL